LCDNELDIDQSAALLKVKIHYTSFLITSLKQVGSFPVYGETFVMDFRHELTYKMSVCLCVCVYPAVCLSLSMCIPMYLYLSMSVCLSV